MQEIYEFRNFCEELLYCKHYEITETLSVQDVWETYCSEFNNLYGREMMDDEFLVVDQWVDNHGFTTLLKDLRLDITVENLFPRLKETMCSFLDK